MPCDARRHRPTRRFRRRRDPVNLVNLRLGLKQDGWLVEAWSKNLFDKQYAAGTTVVSFLNYPFRAPPRTFGLTATYKF